MMRIDALMNAFLAAASLSKHKIPQVIAHFIVFESTMNANYSRYCFCHSAEVESESVAVKAFHNEIYSILSPRVLLE